jgi:phosphatidylinositol alpha-mannosyltransferase
MRAALATAVGTLLSQTLLNVLALVILTIIAVAGSAISANHSTSLVETVALPAALVVVLLGAPALAAHAESVRWRPARAAAMWVQRQLVGVRQGLATFRTPRTAVHAGAFQMLAWGLQLGMCYVVLRAFGLQARAGVPAAAAVLVVVNITAIVPITPSSVGVFQAACIAVLAPFGVRASQGLAYGLVLQAVEIVCALGLGLPALIREGVSLSEMQRSRHRVAEGSPQG